MNSNSIIVREYLETLKEDKELDYLFPILINLMGFRIIQTAKESKGQSQYGKDIIAVGNDENGIKHRWYFELKGYKDKDITDKNFSVTDGIRESIIEAKDTDFSDSSIPGFNDLPIKIVVVHNGLLKANIRPTFEGFISKEFPNGGFERWDINHLTDLFSKHLFSEYLLADDESNRLFKRTLVFLDAPDYDFSDFKKLVLIQFKKTTTVKGRALKKFFSTLNLLISIIFQYSKENNNLVAAKDCSSFIILQTWAWVLQNKIEQKASIIEEFRKLLKIQYDVLNAYFSKTLPIAQIENGLFSENGYFFEEIGYPLRCFDYISPLIYYYELERYFSNKGEELHNNQKDVVIELINNNPGFQRPIIDNHSIPILQILKFFSLAKNRRVKDVHFIANYIFSVVTGIIVIKARRNRLPDGYSRIDLVSEFCISGNKPEEYTDESSILIAILFELLVLLNAKEMYENFKQHLDKEISLQIACPNTTDYDVEQSLFEKHMNAEYYIETNNSLPDSFEEYKDKVKTRKYKEIKYRTDAAGFAFLRTLAHSYYKNELFPIEWRQFFSEENK